MNNRSNTDHGSRVTFGCPDTPSHQRHGISRRCFTELVGTYGLTAVTMTLLGIPNTADAAQIAQATKARSAEEEAKKKKAEVVLILGMEGTTNRYPNGPITKASMQNWGCTDFKVFVERNSGGKIYVDFFEGAIFGAQTKALRKVQQGVFQVGNCSTQNASAVADVWNVLDLPYQIGPFENMWKVMFSKEVAATVRKKSQEANIDMIFNAPWLRWLELGRSVKHEVRQPEHLKSLKIRVTDSKLEQAAFKILPANPTPVAWPETFDALKSGAVDGIHVGPAPTFDAGLGPVVAQMVNVEFMYKNDATWTNVRWLNGLKPALREAVLEAAYEVQVEIYKNFERMLRDQVGIQPDTPTGAGWRAHEADGLKFVRLTESERAAWRDALSIERNKKVLNEMIDRFGRKEYETVIRVANTPGKVEPQRWWA